MATMSEESVQVITTMEQSSLKRAAEAEEMVSPKACRMDFEESSKHHLSPVKKTLTTKFNSSEMPPPNVPSPRKPLGLLATLANRSTNEITASIIKNQTNSSGIDFFESSFENDLSKTSETANIFSPKNTRVTKLARRSTSKPSFASPITSLPAISENDSPISSNAISHDLGIPASLISLLSHPIKCSASEILTPGKENFLRTGVRSLSLGSPDSPQKSDGCKRPVLMREFGSPKSKRIKSVPHFGFTMGKRTLQRPTTLKLFQTETEKIPLAVKNDALDQIIEEGMDVDIINPKKLLRSQSESAVSIMHAVEQSEQDPLLIGDCSKRFILPLMEDDGSKLPDLKLISGHTLSALIEGQYDNAIDRYEIIDCRYPYEYEGGHIKGALNLHTQKQIYEKYMESKVAKLIGSVSNERVVLIFHCEFSSERGPAMCRFVRHADRQCNKDSFPSLHYPEMYILKGGYKSFYENHQENCVPCLYTPMLEPSFAEELRLYRNKSKTELIKSTSSTQLKGVRKMSCKKFVL